MRILIEHPDSEQADEDLVTNKDRTVINIRSTDRESDSIRRSIYYSGPSHTSVASLGTLLNEQEKQQGCTLSSAREKTRPVEQGVQSAEKESLPTKGSRLVGQRRRLAKQTPQLAKQTRRLTERRPRLAEQRPRLAEQRPRLSGQEERSIEKNRVSRLRIWNSQTARLLLILMFLIAVVVALIPLLEKAKSEGAVAQETIRVLMPSGVVNTMALEEYLVGVVAAEMPVDFETNALKAQAVASRTFAARRINSAQESGEAYDVDTTTTTQVWRTEEQMRERWGSSYTESRAKIAEAVQQTAGQVLMYDDNLATTVFFSNTGRLPTEDSTDVWGGNFSYLSSVSSPETAVPDEYVRQKSMSVEEFLRALNLDSKKNLRSSDLKVVERTTAGRIASISVAGQVMKGTDFRKALGLASTDVEWKISDGQILLTTYGNGHGVGLSQYGAQNMALNGKNYQEILEHYYQGTQLESANLL